MYSGQQSCIIPSDNGFVTSWINAYTLKNRGIFRGLGSPFIKCLIVSQERNKLKAIEKGYKGKINQTILSLFTT